MMDSAKWKGVKRFLFWLQFVASFSAKEDLLSLDMSGNTLASNDKVIICKLIRIEVIL